jgi:hypothetical protein
VAVSVTTGEYDALTVFEGVNLFAPSPLQEAYSAVSVQQGRHSQTSKESDVILLQVAQIPPLLLRPTFQGPQKLTTLVSKTVTLFHCRVRQLIP